MSNESVIAYLRSAAAACEDGELKEQWLRLNELYAKKLWHQLTICLLSMLDRVDLIALYDNVISDFDHRIAPKALAHIAYKTVEQYLPSVKAPKGGDASKAFAFVEQIREKVSSSKEATLLCRIIDGNLHLKTSDGAAAKKIVVELEKTIDSLEEVTDVHVRYFELSSLLFKLLGDFAEHYRHSLRYLGCFDWKRDLSNEAKQERALDLALAALLGENVYNFGELLAHDILLALKGSKNEWLIEMLYIFNAGDMRRFKQLETKWAAQLDLKPRRNNLLEKIRLMCLMEMVFECPATARQLHFGDISKRAQLPHENVESLLMKALSIGLLKGSIDEVAQTIHVVWLQPRVLDDDQLRKMQTKLNDWLREVDTMERMVANEARPILPAAVA